MAKRLKGKKILSISLTFTIVLAMCVVMNTFSAEKLDDWLKADYNQMKKRVIHLERENSVLANENEQYKKDISSMLDTINNLTQERDALKNKYADDVERLNSQVKQLTEQKAQVEREGTQKVQELTQLNRDAEMKYGNEIKQLNAEMARQRDLFDQERKTIRAEVAQKEAACAQQIEQLKKDLVQRDTTITSLKTTQSEQSRKLDEALKALDTKNKSVQLLEGQVNDLKGKLKALDEVRQKESQGRGK